PQSPTLTPTLHLLLHFLSLIVPPPRYSLFPYTTLFRSATPWRSTPAAPRKSPRPGPSATKHGWRPTMAAWSNTCPRATTCAFPPDRKSTRLNSSHVSISYAVFCLKKNQFTYTHHHK